MKYFIPAWYIGDKWWQSHSRPYYDELYNKSEFDDLVSLMGMYYQNEKNFEIIILNHFSDLRTFLYRNQLFECSYWSVFDEIQIISSTEPRPIDFRDLDWLNHSNVIYTPYVIRCEISATSYKTIHFSPTGYIIWIETFESHQKVSRAVYDDRGFISQIHYFKDRERIDFLTEAGDVVMTEYGDTYEVKIHEKHHHRFKLTQYTSMDVIIQEFLEAHINEQTHVIAASDVRHNNIINSIIDSEKLTYSVFDKRNTFNLKETIASMRHAKHWLVGLKKNERLLLPENHALMRITPFNTQVITNKSNELYDSYIGFNIDGIDKVRVLKVIKILYEFMKNNKNMKVTLITRENSSHYTYLNEVIEDINQYFLDLDDNYDLLTEENKQKKKVIELLSLPFENDIIEHMKHLRILIDLNHEPDLFMQICCISVGIPQVNLTETDYVKDSINGIVVHQDEEVMMALNYYLTVLKHWNESFAYNVQISEYYASNIIIKHLNQFMEGEYDEKNL